MKSYECKVTFNDSELFFFNYPDSCGKAEKIHSQPMTGNKNEKTEVDEGTNWGGEEEDHPEPEEHKYLLVDIVCGQHTQIIADKKVSYLEAIALSNNKIQMTF